MFFFLRTSWTRFKLRGLALVFALLLLPAVAHGLWDRADPIVDAVPQTEALELAGKYYRGDGLGYNLNVELREDGTFHAEWHGCLGKYGEAQGHWRIENWEVVFEPDAEEGAMVDHLRTLHIFEAEGNWVLVPPNRVEDFQNEGASRWIAFQRVEIIQQKEEEARLQTPDD